MSNDSTGPRIILKDVIPLAVPICVYIEATNRCNFTCPWCPTGNLLQNKISKNSGTMEMSLFLKIIRDFETLIQKKRQKIKTLAMFMLGESFLNKNYLTMLDIAQKANIAKQITITTNGSLIDDEACKHIVKSGVDSVFISMYGCSNEDYKRVSNHFVFDDIIKSSARLMEYRNRHGDRKRPRIFLKYFEDSDDVQASKNLLLKYCDKIAFEEPYNINSIYTEQTGIFINPKPKKRWAKYCSKPWYVMAIGWNGSVLVCCNDWSWSTKVGDVKKSSVEDIWHGENYHLFRKRIVDGLQEEHPACRGCNNCMVNDDDANIIDDLISSHPEKALARPT